MKLFLVICLLAAQSVSGLEFTNQVRLLFDGDSITAGSGVGVTHPYPHYLTNTWLNTVGKWSWITNCAVGGSKLSDVTNRYPTKVYPFRAAGGTNAIYFCYIGWNNTSNNASYDAAGVFFRELSNHWQQATSDGFQVVAFTLPYDYTSFGVNEKTWLTNVNSFIRTSTLPAMVFNTLLWTPGDTNYLADLIHPNDAGHIVIASNLYSRLSGFLQSPSAVETLTVGSLTTQ